MGGLKAIKKGMKRRRCFTDEPLIGRKYGAINSDEEKS
jgi:hypothetical protein